MAGLVYPDGTVRDPSAVAALMGFHGKENGVPLKTPPDRQALKTFLESPDQWPAALERARKAPRTRKEISSLIGQLGALGRMLARPDVRAMKIFEEGLTIGNLFRMGRGAEAIEHYESFLKLVEEAVGK